MTRAVLDACAIIAFLRGEKGAEIVETLLLEEPRFCQIHAINLCEVFYDFLKVADEDTAQRAIADIIATGIEVREDMDQEFWMQAGRYKATLRISLADAFALALASRADAELLTSDHQEFDPVARQGLLAIRFIR
jgi:PIN domain nuclease of toxin-antitoxin system